MFDGIKVLVVEDEVFIALDLQGMLSQYGADVDTALSLRAAKEMLEGDYDVAILDIKLSDGESFEVADQLQKADVPLVFHSAHVHLADLSAYKGAETVSKPATEKALLDAVQRQL